MIKEQLNLKPLKLACYQLSTLQEQQIRSSMPHHLYASAFTANGAVVKTTSSNIRPIAIFLRNSTAIQATVLSELAATDKLGSVGRFSVKYIFLSLAFNKRITVELFSTETKLIPSLAAPFWNNQRVFSSAGWLEREVWDLFGLYFSENGDLRRILTDYGFTGHSLRKDFPLTGFFETVYDDIEGRVTQVPVELTQELRIFNT